MNLNMIPSTARELATEDADSDDEEADEAEVLESAKDLAILTEMCLGWRTSYRRSTPEDFNGQEASVRNSLRTKLKHLKTARQFINHSRTRRRTIQKPDTTVKRRREQQRRSALKLRRKLIKD